MARYTIKRTGGSNNYHVFDNKRNCSIVKTISPNARYNKIVVESIVRCLNESAGTTSIEESVLPISDVVKSLPTEQCVRDWWREGTGDEYFWKHETDWSNEQVFREIYQALTYFINKWQ